MDLISALEPHLCVDREMADTNMDNKHTGQREEIPNGMGLQELQEPKTGKESSGLALRESLQTGGHEWDFRGGPDLEKETLTVGWENAISKSKFSR